MRDHQDLCILQVRRDDGVVSRSEDDGAGLGQPSMLPLGEQVGADQDQATMIPRCSGGGLAESNVEPVLVERADVQRYRPVGQVVGAGVGGSVGIDVDGVGDQRDPWSLLGLLQGG